MESSKIQESPVPSFSHDAPVEAFSEAPTAVQTPIIATIALQDDEKSKKNPNGVAFTATNTIDTLTSDRQDETTEEPENPDLAGASTARKIALLTMFTLAEFLDAFNNSALFPAIPVITSQLHFEASETVWIISAYQLTFAAFLLVVRMSTLSSCHVH